MRAARGAVKLASPGAAATAEGRCSAAHASGAQRRYPPARAGVRRTTAPAHDETRSRPSCAGSAASRSSQGSDLVEGGRLATPPRGLLL